VQVGKDVVVPVEVDLLAPSDDYHEVRVGDHDNVGTREAVLEVTPTSEVPDCYRGASTLCFLQQSAG